MSLRDEAITHMAQAMRVSIAADDKIADTVESLLDALLDFLDAHAEEWSDAEFQATNSEDPAVVLPIRSIDLKRLVAALRGTTEEGET